MATVEKMSIAHTPEMAALVREAVESGEYASSSEVIRDALRDWKRKRTLEQQQVEEVRRRWVEGLNSGSAGTLDMAEIKREARKRFEAE